MKPNPYFKWYILFLACMVTFGGYYSFDYPSVLHNQLRRHFGFEASEFELSFSLLYSLYSMPNVILPAFGGVLSDLWGNDQVMMVCATLVLLGNILLMVATLTTSWLTMELGRFVFGLGAETLQVCANTTIAKWFDGQEVSSHTHAYIYIYTQTHLHITPKPHTLYKMHAHRHVAYVHMLTSRNPCLHKYM
ncbi:MFS transporter [archaeon]|nr:MAG: MFS transporter [archaeon]